LKSAFLVCGTVSAIHIMHGEEQSKGASLQASDGGRAGSDEHWTSDFYGAGGNRFSVDFNETQPARCVRMFHAFKMAEVRDINAVAQAGIKEDCAFPNLQLFIVNNQLDHALHNRLSPRARLRPWSHNDKRPNPEAKSMSKFTRLGGVRGDQGSKPKLRNPHAFAPYIDGF
jgi:hypothetical protein